MLTNKYLKALWLKESDRQSCIDQLAELRESFTQITGVSNTYRHAKLEMEVGDCYISLQQKEKALDHFNRGNEIITHVYGPSHSLHQRYYSFALLYYSLASENEKLNHFAKEVMDLVVRVNGEHSMFNLDTFLTQISVLSDVEAGDSEIIKVIDEMKKCSETSNYLTQAKVIRSMGLFQESLRVYKDVYPNETM